MKKYRLSLLLIFFSPVLTRAQQADTGSIHSFDGTRIYYTVAGQGDPVLLVHGFIVDGSSWYKTAVYKDLLQAGYRVIVPDLRGNGHSGKPAVASAYANDAEARDLMLLMDSLGIQHYRLMGYSRGSIIAARLMKLDPRVQMAVLGGMGDGFTDPEWPRRKMFYRALSGEEEPELAGLLKYVHQAGLDTHLLALMQLEQPATTPRELKKLRMPVLVVSGDQDPDDGSPSKLAAMIPGARLQIVPGDHNGVLRSQPLSDAVCKFFSQPSKVN